MHFGNRRWAPVSWIWLPLTQTAHHPWTTSPSMHCTHTFPSTITPITQLSPFTHQPWLPHHTCTSFTHSHKSSTQTLTHCEVLFCPGYISERSSPYLLSLCVTPDCPTFDLWTCACDLDPCLVLFTSLLCLWYSCFCLLTIACLILPPLNKYWCNWIRTPQTPSLHPGLMRHLAWETRSQRLTFSHYLGSTHILNAFGRIQMSHFNLD